MEWISVKDNIPDKLLEVLTYDRGVYRVGYVIAKQDIGMSTKFRSTDAGSIYYPTHWITLPEPPKNHHQ
jgi:hypothetical protein